MRKILLLLAIVMSSWVCVAQNMQYLREHSTDLDAVIDSYTNKFRAEKLYHNKRLLLSGYLGNIDYSSNEKYKYVMTLEPLSSQVIYIYTNDERFVELSFDNLIYFEANYFGRTIKSEYYGDPCPLEIYRFYDARLIAEEQD